jgi:hypothetical protein
MKMLKLFDGVGMYVAGIKFDMNLIGSDALDVYNTFLEYSRRTRRSVIRRVNMGMSHSKYDYTDKKLQREPMIGVMRVELVHKRDSHCKKTIKLCTLSGDKHYAFRKCGLNMRVISGYTFVNVELEKDPRIYNMSREEYTMYRFKKSCAAVKLYIALTEALQMRENLQFDVTSITMAEMTYKSDDDFSGKLKRRELITRLAASCEECVGAFEHAID